MPKLQPLVGQPGGDAIVADLGWKPAGPLPVRRAREYISGFDSWNHSEAMNGESMEMDDEGSVPARAVWPWAVFTVALGAGIVLFFVYPPR